MIMTRKFAATLAVFGCTFSLAAQHGQPPAGLSKTVALTSGVCALVSEGDTVTLEWNPAFDNAPAVAGLRNLSLNFALVGEEGHVRRGSGGIHLTAVPHDGQHFAAPDAIVAAPNGFFQIKFRVSLNHAASGSYHLIDAIAEPMVAPEYQGKRPEMTNSPINSSFCLTVADRTSAQDSLAAPQ